LIALSFAYGVSATEALEAAQIFAQQGKTVKETLELTQQAMLAAQVLGTDVRTVVEDLTAALNSFNIPMEHSVSVIDKWIGVEKEFAVTSKDLANATKVAGATANQLGISISELLGDVTSVVEVTRKSGEEAARGLSFIYARLLSTGKPVVEQIAKIKFYLDEEGKATSALTGTLRPTAEILGDLANKWGSLTNEERLSIAAAVASKRQMTVLNALMQNYNRSLDARVKALTSAGAAEKAFGIIQDTTAFKLKQLTSSWNNLTNAVANTSGFKAGLGFLNDMLVTVTYMVDKEKAYKEAISSRITAMKIEAQKSQLLQKIINEYKL
jgi:TP901 family phage tail tape measure protein